MLVQISLESNFSKSSESVSKLSGFLLESLIQSRKYANGEPIQNGKRPNLSLEIPASSGRGCPIGERSTQERKNMLASSHLMELLSSGFSTP